MTLESLIEKRPRYTSRFVREQLRFHAMNSGRLLQGLDDMRQQFDFYLASVGKASAVRHEKIADHSFAAFIHEKAVAEDAAALDGGVSGKDFRVNVAQDHL